MKRKLIFLFALVVAMGTNVQAQSLKKDYKLPDNVPAEVQADDFRMVREDFACFYNAQYKGHLKAKDILVEGVEGYEMPGGGYALVFSCKLPGEQTMQFGVYAGGVPMMNGGMGTKVVTCDVHPGFTYFTSTEGKIDCKSYYGLFFISVAGTEHLLVGTKEQQIKCLYFNPQDYFDLSSVVPEHIRADNFRLVREDFAHLYEVAYQERLSADDIHIEMVEYAEYEGGYALFFTGKYANGDVMKFVAVTSPSLTPDNIPMKMFSSDLQSGLMFYAPYERGKHIGVNRFNGRLQIFCPEGLIMLGSDKEWWKER